VLTLNSDHFLFHSGMEVVLPTGDLIRTGQGAMSNTTTWQTFPYGSVDSFPIASSDRPASDLFMMASSASRISALSPRWASI